MVPCSFSLQILNPTCMTLGKVVCLWKPGQSCIWTWGGLLLDLFSHPLSSSENLIRTLADLQPRFNSFIQIFPLNSAPLVFGQCPRDTSRRQNQCGIPEPLKDTGSWENPFPYCSQLCCPDSLARGPFLHLRSEHHSTVTSPSPSNLCLCPHTSFSESDPLPPCYKGL